MTILNVAVSLGPTAALKPPVVLVLRRRQLCIAASLALVGCASEPQRAPTRVLVVPEQVWDGESPALADRVAARVLVTMNEGSVSFLDVGQWRQGLQ